MTNWNFLDIFLCFCVYVKKKYVRHKFNRLLICQMNISLIFPLSRVSTCEFLIVSCSFLGSLHLPLCSAMLDMRSSRGYAAIPSVLIRKRISERQLGAGAEKKTTAHKCFRPRFLLPRFFFVWKRYSLFRRSKNSHIMLEYPYINVVLWVLRIPF